MKTSNYYIVTQELGVSRTRLLSQDCSPMKFMFISTLVQHSQDGSSALQPPDDQTASHEAASANTAAATAAAHPAASDCAAAGTDQG